MFDIEFGSLACSGLFIYDATLGLVRLLLSSDYHTGWLVLSRPQRRCTDGECIRLERKEGEVVYAFYIANGRMVRDVMVWMFCI